MRVEVPSPRIPAYEAIDAFKGEFFALGKPVFGTIGAEQLDPAHVDKCRSRTQAAVSAPDTVNILGGGRDGWFDLHGPHPATLTEPA